MEVAFEEKSVLSWCVITKDRFWAIPQVFIEHRSKENRWWWKFVWRIEADYNQADKRKTTWVNTETNRFISTSASTLGKTAAWRTILLSYGHLNCNGDSLTPMFESFSLWGKCCTSKVAIGHDLTVVAMLAWVQTTCVCRWKKPQVTNQSASAHKQDSSWLNLVLTLTYKDSIVWNIKGIQVCNSQSTTFNEERLPVQSLVRELGAYISSWQKSKTFISI